jgi:hypothetical protein
LLAAAFSGPKLYDPYTGVFSLTGTELRGEPGPATLLTNGKVLIAGSWSDDPGPSTNAELYDPSTETFGLTGNMTAPRANHTATLLPDGEVLITGGTSFTTTAGGEHVYFCCVASAELYDSHTGVFASIDSMTAVRGGHTATLLNSGEVLIVGDGGGVATAELFHPETLIPAPALFSLSGDGRGQGAIRHATGGSCLAEQSGRCRRDPVHVHDQSG